MALIRNLLSHRLHRSLHFFTLHPPPTTPFSSSSLKTPPFPHRHITTPLSPNPQIRTNKKPLHALFMESVVFDQKTQEEGEPDDNSELQRNLRKLEEEVRRKLEGSGKVKPKKKRDVAVGKTKRRSLFALFTNQPDDRDDDGGGGDGGDANQVRLLREPMVLKELSPDMEIFVEFLFRNGYFNDANFVKGNDKFDIRWFDSFFARGYIKCAAQRFGKDNQEIAKWLSGSALKEVAVFGCPSNDRSSVFPAKRLRIFFEVQENTVCAKCTLRQSCKFVNQSVWKNYTKTLDLVAVMKVLTPYALELVHPQLAVPDEVKKSVSKLLKEVVKLSQTTSR